MSATTYLFVPGNRPERFAKAMAAGADRIIVDLEDAVAPQDKAHARAAVRTWMLSLDAAQRATVLVRINDALSAWFADDLQLLSSAQAVGVMLSKCEHKDQIEQARKALLAHGLVTPLVETAKGVLNLPAIAAAPGVDRIAFGSLDYMLDLDLPGDGLAVDLAATQIAMASRAAGLPSPVAGVTPAMDAARVAADMLHYRALGYGAKMCIHPMQVTAVLAALAPGETELAWARRVMAAWAQGNGSGSIQLDGKMVDKPVVLKAQRTLALSNPSR
ncbi:MAG: CoA ester lyase [Rhodoferax sp.]